MRRTAAWMLMIVMAASLCGCWRRDVQTVGFSVPAMKNSECSRIIQDSLMAFEGVVSAQPDFEKGVIFVTYDSKKLANVNVEHTIAALGFDVNTVQAHAEAKAKLPAACR